MSASVTVTLNEPVSVGVPPMTPVFESIVMPAGRLVADQPYGVRPPVPVIVVFGNAVLMLPVGSDAGPVIDGTGKICTVSEKFVVAPRESVNVKLTVRV